MLLFWSTSQVNYPYPTNYTRSLPAYPVREFCSRFHKSYDPDGKPEEFLVAFSKALQVLSNYTGSEECLSFEKKYDEAQAWNFQRCTELIYPNCSNGTNEADLQMFLPYKWHSDENELYCFIEFDVVPRGNMLIENYGSFEHGSNIIFSNGLLDPWIGYGVTTLFNDKHEIVLIKDAAHILDLRADNPADPPSVRIARNFYIAKFKEWIEEFKRM